MGSLLQSRQYLLILLCFFVFLWESRTAESRTLYYKWEVKSELKSPDCFKKLTLTINGRSPGPTIYAHQGDTVIVELKNSFVTENVAIHWHGIRQVFWVSSCGFGLVWFGYFFFCCNVFGFCVVIEDWNTLERWNRGCHSMSCFAWWNIQISVCCRQGECWICWFLFFLMKNLGLSLSNLKFAARDLLIPCALRHAKRRWSVWIHCGLASRGSNRAVRLRSWSESYTHRLVS